MTDGRFTILTLILNIHDFKQLYFLKQLIYSKLFQTQVASSDFLGPQEQLTKNLFTADWCKAMHDHTKFQLSVSEAKSTH